MIRPGGDGASNLQWNPNWEKRPTLFDKNLFIYFACIALKDHGIDLIHKPCYMWLDAFVLLVKSFQPLGGDPQSSLHWHHQNPDQP